MTAARPLRRLASWRFLSMAAAGTALLALAGSAGRVGTTWASWTDTEHVHGQMGTASSWCLDGMYTAAASGTMLAGTTLEQVGPVVRWQGVRVVHDGSAATVDPSGTPAVDDETYAGPLVIGAVQDLIAANLSGALTLPLPGVEAGLLGQYAHASGAGRSIGSAGAVGADGAIEIGATGPGQPAPTSATVDLQGVLGGLLVDAVGPQVAQDVGDLHLEVGALAARADLDGCPERGDATPVREYLVTGLSVATQSPLVADVASTATHAVAGVQAVLEGADPLTAGLSSAITDAVDGVLGGLAVAVLSGPPVVDVSTSLDLPALVAPVVGSVETGHGVEVDLTKGTVRLDIAGLVDQTHGLNQLEPNTEVLTQPVLGAALTHLDAVLDAWLEHLLGTVEQAIAGSGLHITAQVPLNVLSSGLSLGVLEITLAVPLDLSSDTTASVQLVGCPVLTALVCGLVNGVLGLVQLALVTDVAGTVESAVFGPDGVLHTLTGTMGDAVGAVLSTVGPVLDALPALVSLQVNVQPDQPGARTPSLGTAAGEYAVSALRLAVLDPASLATALLATATVGPNEYRYG